MIFFIAEVLPATFPRMDQSLIRFIGKGVNGIIVYKGSKLFSSLREPLASLGVLDEAGQVDIEFVKTFLESGFNGNECLKIKTLPLIPANIRNAMPRFVQTYGDHTWTFRKSDADKFLAMLQE